MTATERLDQWAALADGAQPAPWTHHGVERAGWFVETPESEETGDYPVAEVPTAANAAFIAASREAVPALIAAVKAALAVHVRDEIPEAAGPICAECSDVHFELYPCPTVRAIASALDGA